MKDEVALPGAAELERLAVDLAEGAAALVRDTGTGGIRIAAKSTATDLVTEVDRAVERWLVERIRALRPDDGILGEEGGGRPGTSGVRWVVDPIDGTVNFVLGLPQFAVSVAAEVEGRSVAGAVANPLTGETFRARIGGGAHLGAERLTGPRQVALSRAVIGTGFGYDATVRARQVAAVVPLLPAVGDLRRLGAASLDLCFVAAGRLDAYFEAGLNLWDHAAGGLIATEAGCVTSGLRGRPPSAQCYAVAGPGLAAEFFALLESVDADRVGG
ncbi:MAG: monophosphatase [Pseudonocardiales bacterium]|nr:monophosphatase [Pseudonocardiales bacterium]